MLSVERKENTLSCSSFIVVGEVDEDLLCPVSKQPLYDPVVHIACKNTLCRGCLMKCENCPLCREPVSSKNFGEVPRLVTNLLDKIIISCETCKEKIPRSKFLEHTNNKCPIQCPLGCGDKIVRSQLSNHPCPNLLVHCAGKEFKCSWFDKKSLLAEHEKICPVVALIPILQLYTNQLTQLSQQVYQLSEWKNKIQEEELKKKAQEEELKKKAQEEELKKKAQEELENVKKWLPHENVVLENNNHTLRKIKNQGWNTVCTIPYLNRKVNSFRVRIDSVNSDRSGLQIGFVGPSTHRSSGLNFCFPLMTCDDVKQGTILDFRIDYQLNLISCNGKSSSFNQDIQLCACLYYVGDQITILTD